MAITDSHLPQPLAAPAPSFLTRVIARLRGQPVPAAERRVSLKTATDRRPAHERNYLADIGMEVGF